jgi:hypothetical protein
MASQRGERLLRVYAVPTNSRAMARFRFKVVRVWYRALRRRNQRTRLNWERMCRLAARWVPPFRIPYPWPDMRFDARTLSRSPVGSPARWDLCGGPPPRAVSTAIETIFQT